MENGTKIADSTANALVMTVESTKVAVDVVDKITQATTEQSNAIQEVTQGIDQISSVVQTNSATAECGSQRRAVQPGRDAEESGKTLQTPLRCGYFLRFL